MTEERRAGLLSWEPSKAEPVTTVSRSVPTDGIQAPFSSGGAFEQAQRMARCIAASTLVPAEYQGDRGLPNAVIALELAARLNASVFMVMQNVSVIRGKPFFSAQFIIAAINTCGRFAPLKFESDDENGGRCRAWTTELGSGEKVIGPWVSMEMAKAEGWVSNAKWRSMPEIMLRYRAASFFGRLYAPDVMLGMYSDDEAVTMQEPARQTRPRLAAEDIPTEAEVLTPEPAAPAEEAPRIAKKARGRAKDVLDHVATEQPDTWAHLSEALPDFLQDEQQQ